MYGLMVNLPTKILLGFFCLGTLGIAQHQNGTASADDLGKQVLTALAAKDLKSLDSLTITEAEFKKYVWPAMATNVTDTKMTADKFYGIYTQSSQLGKTSAIESLGGKSLQLIKFVPGRATRQGKDYKLYLSPEMTVRDESGQEKTIRPVGGILEQGGAYKVTTYYVRPNSSGSK